MYVKNDYSRLSFTREDTLGGDVSSNMCTHTQTEVDSNTLVSALTYKHEDTQSQRHVYLVELSDICLT